jgi:hypothetical protein
MLFFFHLRYMQPFEVRACVRALYGYAGLVGEFDVSPQHQDPETGKIYSFSRQHQMWDDDQGYMSSLKCPTSDWNPLPLYAPHPANALSSVTVLPRLSLFVVCCRFPSAGFGFQLDRSCSTDYGLCTLLGTQYLPVNLRLSWTGAPSHSCTDVSLPVTADAAVLIAMCAVLGCLACLRTGCLPDSLLLRHRVSRPCNTLRGAWLASPRSCCGRGTSVRGDTTRTNAAVRGGGIYGRLPGQEEKNKNGKLRTSSTSARACAMSRLVASDPTVVRMDIEPH